MHGSKRSVIAMVVGFAALAALQPALCGPLEKEWAELEAKALEEVRYTGVLYQVLEHCKVEEPHRAAFKTAVLANSKSLVRSKTHPKLKTAFERGQNEQDAFSTESPDICSKMPFIVGGVSQKMGMKAAYDARNPKLLPQKVHTEGSTVLLLQDMRSRVIHAVETCVAEESVRKELLNEYSLHMGYWLSKQRFTTEKFGPFEAPLLHEEEKRRPALAVNDPTCPTRLFVAGQLSTVPDILTPETEDEEARTKWLVRYLLVD